MSDAPGGEGWWQASDDKWYPPDARPEPPKPPPAPPKPPAAPAEPPQRRQRAPEFTSEELAARRAARDHAAAASTRRAQGVGCLAVLVIIGLLWALGAALGGSGNDDDSPDELQYGAFDVCTQFVKQRLISPASARFPNEFEDDGEVTITSAGSTFTVVSHVDSQNGFGALLTTPFTCRVRHVDGDNWRLVDLQLVE